jgi:hypothetical protein
VKTGRSVLPLGACLLLAACGAGEVMQTGPNTFQVSAQEGILC